MHLYNEKWTSKIYKMKTKGVFRMLANSAIILEMIWGDELWTTVQFAVFKELFVLMKHLFTYSDPTAPFFKRIFLHLPSNFQNIPKAPYVGVYKNQFGAGRSRLTASWTARPGTPIPLAEVYEMTFLALGTYIDRGLQKWISHNKYHTIILFSKKI